jgi:hypothetical protein
MVLMFALSVFIARAQERTVAKLKASAPSIKLWGGIVLLGVGAWFIILGVFADTFAEVFPV